MARKVNIFRGILSGADGAQVGDLVIHDDALYELESTGLREVFKFGLTKAEPPIFTQTPPISEIADTTPEIRNPKVTAIKEEPEQPAKIMVKKPYKKV